jgi:hypothetical protein
MAQEVCRILDKSGYEPRDLGSCKVLTGKIQEASGMRLGTSFPVCTNNHFLRRSEITKESSAVSTEKLEKNKTITIETHETHS